MATPSQSFQIRKSYGHNFSRVVTHNLQATYESTIKNGHRILADDVWIDAVDFCADETTADLFCDTHPTILKKHTKVELEAVSGTNNQSYRYVSAGVWINNWIAPVDVVNSAGLSSQGFAARLFDAHDVPISLTEGVYVINYFTGMIEFDVGYTPIDRGYALPIKATFYEYIGKTLNDIITPVIREARDRFHISDPGIVDYTISQSPKSLPKVFCNGVLMSPDDYICNDTDLHFAAGTIDTDDWIDVFFQY